MGLFRRFFARTIMGTPITRRHFTPVGDPPSVESEMVPVLLRLIAGTAGYRAAFPPAQVQASGSSLLLSAATAPRSAAISTGADGSELLLSSGVAGYNAPPAWLDAQDVSMAAEP